MPKEVVSVKTMPAKAATSVFLAKDSQLDAGPVFFHLNGGQKDVQGAGGEELVDRGASDFRGEVVEIRFDADDAVLFQVVGFDGVAQDGAQYVRDDAGWCATRRRSRSSRLAWAA